MKAKFIPLIIFSALLIGLFWWFGSSKQESQIESQIERGLPILVKLFEGNADLSFRGIATVDDSVVWVSGNQGVFGKSLDYGAHWVFGRVPGADSLELRDIELLDEHTAVVMSSGYPTKIFKTVDGGESWKTVYANDNERMFLDGMDFCICGKGLAFGDPIQGKFVLLRSTDEGDSWTWDSTNAPLALEGEAGFAASGSSIQCFNCKNVVIGTGGSKARILFSASGYQWSEIDQPILAGTSSQGIFSMAANDSLVIVVGGDYQVDTAHYSCGIWPGATPGFVKGGELPYQSSVVFVNDSTLISIGTPGGYVSRDFGQSWQQFTKDGMHTLAAGKSGEIVYAAGGNGRIAKIVFNKDQITP